MPQALPVGVGVVELSSLQCLWGLYGCQENCKVAELSVKYVSCETHKTVNTRNIYGMLLCYDNQAIRHEITYTQTAMVISLWFRVLLAYS